MDTATQNQRTEERNYGTVSMNKSLIRCFNFARYWAGKIAQRDINKTPINLFNNTYRHFWHYCTRFMW